MVGEKVLVLKEAEAKERQREGQERGRKSQKGIPVTVPETKGDSRDAAGKVVGVSGKLIDRARKVRREGIPEVARAVEEGRMSVTRAAQLVEDEEDVQREVSAASTFSGGRYREPRVRERVVPEVPKSRGVGVRWGNAAVDCLKKIPDDDLLRKRGFQIVTDWIRSNK